MRNQQLTYQGLGSLRLLLGFLILFVIWHQCRAYTLRTICSRRPEDCKNVKLFYEGRECVRYICYQDVNEFCNGDDIKCNAGLTCKCGKCVNCQGNICKLDLCDPQGKRFPKRFPAWNPRARSENLPQKYVDTSYDDETINFK